MKYIIAIYLRLSVDDKRIESMSIESQRLLLRKYAEKLADDVEIIEYVDNGYTGTNFERPGVQQLLCDIKAYKINCVLVRIFLVSAETVSKSDILHNRYSLYSECVLYPSAITMTATNTRAIQAVFP